MAALFLALVLAVSAAARAADVCSLSGELFNLSSAFSVDLGAKVPTPNGHEGELITCTKDLQDGFQSLANSASRDPIVRAMDASFSNLLKELPPHDQNDCETELMKVQDFLLTLKKFIGEVQTSHCH